MTLNFSDGVRVDTDGPARPLKLDDGWYVAGRGCLEPVENREEAERLAKELAEGEEAKP